MKFNPQNPGRSVWVPKSYKIPNDLTLIIDTREQKPLCTRVKTLPICREALKNGDYSIKGFEDQFTIERKQQSDFYSYIGSERKRTKQKLERLKTYKFKALIIESTWDDLMIPGMFSSISSETARQFLISIRVRYGIHVVLDPKRKNLEMFIVDSAIKFLKVMREV